MKDGKAFYKFNEGDIDFPPTFKVRKEEERIADFLILFLT